MGFFDNFKEKAADLAQAGVAQSKRLAEIAKLKTANMGEEDTIKKAYIELGKLYYAEKGAAPEAAYAASCEKITAAKAAIEANNDRIAELKSSADDEVEVVAQVEPVEPAAERRACHGLTWQALFRMSSPFFGQAVGEGGELMEQYYRLPQDVVGHDPVLLSYWDRMPPRARLRLLESDISVSTLGELQKLGEELGRDTTVPPGLE